MNDPLVRLILTVVHLKPSIRCLRGPPFGFRQMHAQILPKKANNTDDANKLMILILLKVLLILKRRMILIIPKMPTILMLLTILVY